MVNTEFSSPCAKQKKKKKVKILLLGGGGKGTLEKKLTHFIFL